MNKDIQPLHFILKLLSVWIYHNKKRNASITHFYSDFFIQKKFHQKISMTQLLIFIRFISEDYFLKKKKNNSNHLFISKS
ncbi:MAG: hypothetical protein CL678_04600 [Bdellovibrionaceae bacterium]|nr:hypothetical protein [Pseudobdellovibrionaceae bacterium]|tara:strand:- start:2325 stop:2564 length:240 start_codon:yes stop_codon:yes gene_type:complete